MGRVLNETEDMFNAKGTRNVDNTDEDDYNCAGYALNTFAWYIPYNGSVEDEEIDIACMLTDGMSREEIYEIKLAEYVKIMLDDFPHLRVLTSPTEVKSNERLIYFRMFYELICSSLEELMETTEEYNGEEIHTDFHYRFFKDGKWFEKCGGSELEEVPMEEMEGTWVCGFNEYDSRTVYLALEMEEQ